MQILGHKTRSMLDRYDVVNESDLRDAANRLEVAMRTRTMTTSVTGGEQQDQAEQLTH
jgi:hypothetical protein